MITDHEYRWLDDLFKRTQAAIEKRMVDDEQDIWMGLGFKRENNQNVNVVLIAALTTDDEPSVENITKQNIQYPVTDERPS